MLDSQEFLDKLVARGFDHLCVVPCSFAKNLINAVINHPDIEYVPAASEAVACSVAAGLKMAGVRPVVIVQSSGMTNMGSCITSLLKPYRINFPIITSWRTWQEGDSEIQHQHLATALPELIAAYGYEHRILDRDDVDKAVSQVELSDRSPCILVLQADTFSPVALERDRIDLSAYPPRSTYLSWLNSYYAGSDAVFIGTTGNTAREMYTLMPDTDHFYMAGNMGGALSVGLGACLGGRRVVVCGGDAEMMMHLGGMVTAGRYRQPQGRLLYVVFDNESNKSTGGQNSYQQHVEYEQLAASCGFLAAPEVIETTAGFEQAVIESEQHNRPYFIHVKCSYDDTSPRPPADAIRGSKQVFKGAGGD